MFTIAVCPYQINFMHDASPFLVSQPTQWICLYLFVNGPPSVAIEFSVWQFLTVMYVLSLDDDEFEEIFIARPEDFMSSSWWRSIHHMCKDTRASSLSGCCCLLYVCSCRIWGVAQLSLRKENKRYKRSQTTITDGIKLWFDTPTDSVLLYLLVSVLMLGPSTPNCPFVPALACEFHLCLNHLNTLAVAAGVSVTLIQLCCQSHYGKRITLPSQMTKVLVFSLCSISHRQPWFFYMNVCMGFICTDLW